MSDTIMGYTCVVAHIQKDFRNTTIAFESILAIVFLVICAPFAYHIIFGIPYNPKNILEVEEVEALHCLCGMTCFKTSFEDFAPRRFPLPERSNFD